jgi:hypothetical protein
VGVLIDWWQAVGDRLLRERVLDFVERLRAVASDGRLCDMHKTVINPNCNTPGCHAGWAAIALGAKGNSFQVGMKALATHLGFLNLIELRAWAKNNPDIWGNPYGKFMFQDGYAFGQKSNVFSVDVLINHWQAVGERLL